MAKWFCACFNPSKTAKLVRFDGGGERIKIDTGVVRMKVAELMLDNPNRFVCKLGALEAGNRILALPAEEEIEAGNTYVLFNMQRLRSVLSESDMCRIQQLMKKKSKAKSSHSKIVPLCHEGFEAEKLCLPKMEANEEEIESLKVRICGQRCWKPSLHTIQETRSLKFAENAEERPVFTFRLRKRH